MHQHSDIAARAFIGIVLATVTTCVVAQQPSPQPYPSKPIRIVVPLTPGGSTNNIARLLPGVPTFIEAGLPAYNEKAWQGVFVPAGTPKPIVDKLSAEIARILAAPDVKDKLDKQGVEPFISTPEQFAAMIKAETAKLTKLIEAAHIKLDN